MGTHLSSASSSAACFASMSSVTTANCSTASFDLKLPGYSPDNILLYKKLIQLFLIKIEDELIMCKCLALGTRGYSHVSYFKRKTTFNMPNIWVTTSLNNREMSTLHTSIYQTQMSPLTSRRAGIQVVLALVAARCSAVCPWSFWNEIACYLQGQSFQMQSSERQTRLTCASFSAPASIRSRAMIARSFHAAKWRGRQPAYTVL